MSSDFGDWTDDDALDHEPADPEQLAVEIQKLRIQRGLSTARWEDFSPPARAIRIDLCIALLAWLRRSGAT